MTLSIADQGICGDRTGPALKLQSCRNLDITKHHQAHHACSYFNRNSGCRVLCLGFKVIHVIYLFFGFKIFEAHPPTHTHTRTVIPYQAATGRGITLVVVVVRSQGILSLNEFAKQEGKWPMPLCRVANSAIGHRKCILKMDLKRSAQRDGAFILSPQCWGLRINAICHRRLDMLARQDCSLHASPGLQ